MSRRRFLAVALTTVVALAALAAGLLAACGSSSGGSNSAPTATNVTNAPTITFWHGYTDIERTATEQFIARYNAANPGSKVTSVFAGNNDYALQKLLTALASGKYPDIAYEYGSSMANLVASPKLVDLDPLFKASPGFDWNDYFPAERLAATVNGKVMGVPALVDNLALVYNKKLFDAAGVAYPTADWTWADFRAAAKKLTDASKQQFGWAYVNDASEDTVWRFLALLWQAGGDLLTPDNSAPAFDSPAGLKAMTLLHDMAVTDKSVYLDSGNDNYLNLFNSGKIAMLWTGPWDISSINAGVQFGVQILPADVSHATIAGPDNYVVLNNGAQRVASAWKFIQWFESPAIHLQYCIATGHLPIRESETKLPAYQQYLAKFPADAVFVANLKNVTKSRPNIAVYPKISASLGQAVQSVLLGKASPQQALSACEQDVSSILASGQ